MKKLLLCSLAMVWYLGDAQAGNGPEKRRLKFSAEKIKAESKIGLLERYARMEALANMNNPQPATAAPAPARKGKSNSSQALSFSTLGVSLNPLTVSGTQRNYVSVIPSLNTVGLFRRGGEGDPVGSTNAPGNKLVYDYSTNGGADWTLRGGNVHTDDIYANNPSWPLYSTTNNFGARYPQGVLWNPQGNTNPANIKAFGLSAALTGSNAGWGGLARGWRNLGPDASSYAMWDSGDPVLHYISDGLEVAPNGDIFCSIAELDAEALANTDKILVYKFSYNSNTNRFDSTLIILPFPNEPGDYATVTLNTNISFAPSGNVGFLVMNAYNIAYDSLLTVSLYVSKTTDGGTTWSDFKVINPNYKNDVDNTADIDAFREQMLGNYVRFDSEGNIVPAQRGDEYAHRVDYTVKDFDVTVDQYGYAHILAEYCITSFGDTIANNPGDAGVFYPGYGAWFAHITVNDISQPIFAYGDIIGRAENVRGCFGLASECTGTTSTNSIREDNRPQVARSEDGSTIAMVWYATDEEAHPQGATNFNSNPDMWVRYVKTTAPGVYLANDQQRNVSKGSDYDGLIICGSVAPVLMNRPGGGYDVAATAVDLPTTQVISPWPATHYFMRNVKVSDTIDTPIAPKVLRSNSVINNNYAGKLQLGFAPNPSAGKTTLMFHSKNSGMVHVRIINSMGKEITRFSHLVPSGDVKLPLDLTSLNSGIYFVNVNLNGLVSTQRLVKN